MNVEDKKEMYLYVCKRDKLMYNMPIVTDEGTDASFMRYNLPSHGLPLHSTAKKTFHLKTLFKFGTTGIKLRTIYQQSLTGTDPDLYVALP